MRGGSAYVGELSSKDDATPGRRGSQRPPPTRPCPATAGGATLGSMNAHMTLRTAALAAALLATPVAAAEPALQDLVGREIAAEAVALDGDTLLIVGPAEGLPAPIRAGRTRLRLWGIAAPEMDDPRGPAARAALDVVLRGTATSGELGEIPLGRVACRILGVHGHRLVGLCNGGTRDFGEVLLRQGFATADRRFTYAEPGDPEALARARLYDQLEAWALDEGKGFWAGRGW